MAPRPPSPSRRSLRLRLNCWATRRRKPRCAPSSRPMPAVSAAEVAALKAEGEARGLDGADNALETVAEQLAFLVYECRHFGADQAEVLHEVELLVRAVEFNRSELREARDVLRALNYPREL